MRRSMICLSLALLAALPACTFAQVTTFLTDDPQRSLGTPLAAQTNFLAALPLNGTDNLESATLFAPNPSLSFGVFGTTATTNATYVATDGTTFYPTSGINFVVASFTVADQFTFNQPVAGLGMYFIQTGDVQNETSFIMQLTNSVTNTTKNIPINFSGDGTGSPNVFQRVISPLTPRADNNVFYFGVIDPALFDGMTLLKTTTVNGVPGNQGSDGVLFDDISVGFIVAVPEPSTYAMIGCVLLGSTGFYARYRMKRQANENARFRRA